MRGTVKVFLLGIVVISGVFSKNFVSAFNGIDPSILDNIGSNKFVPNCNENIVVAENLAKLISQDNPNAIRECIACRLDPVKDTDAITARIALIQNLYDAIIEKMREQFKKEHSIDAEYFNQTLSHMNLASFLMMGHVYISMDLVYDDKSSGNRREFEYTGAERAVVLKLQKLDQVGAFCSDALTVQESNEIEEIESHNFIITSLFVASSWLSVLFSSVMYFFYNHCLVRDYTDAESKSLTDHVRGCCRAIGNTCCPSNEKHRTPSNVKQIQKTFMKDMQKVRKENSVEKYLPVQDNEGYNVSGSPQPSSSPSSNPEYDEDDDLKNEASAFPSSAKDQRLQEKLDRMAHK